MKNIVLTILFLIVGRAEANTVILCEKDGQTLQVYIPLTAQEKASFEVRTTSALIGSGEFQSVVQGRDSFLGLWVIGATADKAVVGVALLDSKDHPTPGTHPAKGDIMVVHQGGVFEGSSLDCNVIVPAVDPVL